MQDKGNETSQTNWCLTNIYKTKYICEKKPKQKMWNSNILFLKKNNNQEKTWYSNKNLIQNILCKGKKSGGKEGKGGSKAGGWRTYIGSCTYLKRWNSI